MPHGNDWDRQTRQADITHEARSIRSGWGKQIPNYEDARACLFHAMAVVRACDRWRERGVFDLPAQLQGGSANWRLVSEGKDGGRSPTHYSYEHSNAACAALLRTLDGDHSSMLPLPEVHFWAAVPPGRSDLWPNGLVIDTTTGFLPTLVTEMLEPKITAPDRFPPAPVWLEPTACGPAGCSYRPSWTATALGYALFAKGVADFKLKG